MVKHAQAAGPAGTGPGAAGSVAYVAPDADDEDEPTGGPPPDPTLRAWRHPSEIASAEAAAARFRQQDARSRSADAPTPLAFHRADRSDRANGRSPFAYLALTAMAAAAAVVAVALGTGMFYADVDGIGRGVDSMGGSTSLLGGGGATAALPPVGDPPATTLVTLTMADMGAGVYAGPDHRPPRLAGVTLVGDALLTLSSALGDRKQVTVEADGLSAPADVVGRDEVTDVAVLRLTGDRAAEVLHAVSASQARTAVRGAVVQAGQTSRNRAGEPVYGTLLTGTTCADAGGMALVDDEGRVIGLIVDTASPVVEAVPIEDALAAARSLTAGSGPWLGVTGKTSPKGGVQITSVTAGSPADLIGLRVGDRLLEVNDTEVADWRQLIWMVRHAGAGGGLSVVFERQGTRITISATVGTRPNG